MIGHGFEGKVAVITGASRGIGLSIAQLLVDAGAVVCITARKEPGLKEAVSRLGPTRAIGVAGRADDPANQDEAIERTLSTFGHIDYLVNAAGVNPAHGQIVDADLGAIRKTFEVNLFAPIAWTKKVWEASLHDNGGAIVNLASLSGIVTWEQSGVYNASKAGLIHLTKQLAVELAPGVRVNAVAPALVRTQFSRYLYGDQEEEISALHPLQRFGTAEDVARAVVFLLSDQAAWITGQTIVLDGGLGLRVPSTGVDALTQDLDRPSHPQRVSSGWRRRG
jgi:3-oxoacyl-[acyl-carrier protein] reductase